MTRRKPNQLQELKDRIAMLEGSMANVATMSIVYLPGGQVIGAALTVGQDPARILSAKRALQQVINHLDDLLMVAQVQVPGPQGPPVPVNSE
jgi:hypothetical protein